MKKISVVFVLLSSLSLSASAGISNQARFQCKVGSYDTKMVNLNCAGKDGKFSRTPRAWLPSGTKLKQGETIKLVLSVDQFNQWDSFDSRSAASEK